MSKIPDGWVRQGDGSYSPPPKIKSSAVDIYAPPESVPPIVKAVMEISVEREQQSEESKLNKTEKARLLFLRSRRYPNILIQSITLKLAFDCRLTADFTYTDDDGRLMFEDVKGFQREDALIKIKVAARMYPMFKFSIVKKDGSGWKVQKVVA